VRDFEEPLPKSLSYEVRDFEEPLPKSLSYEARNFKACGVGNTPIKYTVSYPKVQLD
jgi:hypothetical protein